MMSRTSLVSPKQSVLRIMTDAADLTDSMEHDVSSMFKWLFLSTLLVQTACWQDALSRYRSGGSFKMHRQSGLFALEGCLLVYLCCSG